MTISTFINAQLPYRACPPGPAHQSCPHSQSRRSGGQQGYSLTELLFVLGVMTTVAGVASANVLAGLDEIRTAAAVRYLAARLQQTRMMAINHGGNTALRFTRDGESYRYRLFEDRNGDGVRNLDILNGTDVPIGGEESIRQQFSGVDFGVLPVLPAVDSSSGPPGTDPIKLGSSDMASFAPLGTSSSGSLYLLGPRQIQYVIRLDGDTGKIRILKFNPRTSVWDPQ